jgi:hypothetical protein
MGFLAQAIGVMKGFFQFGGPAGPGINANGAALETKNAANSAFAVHRGATPVGDNDFTTKAYVDTIFKPMPVSVQFNGNSTLPANSAVEKYYIVTTTGPNATIGQILWDDGSNAGTVTVLPAAVGNEIVTTAAFSGGTITLQSNQNYVWSGAAWVSISPSVAGALFWIRMPITNAASQSSTTVIPANAVVARAVVTVTTTYSAGATISVGQTGTTALLMATADSSPTIVNSYDAPQDTAWGASALAVLVTIGGAPAAGAGFVSIYYAVPQV